MFNKTLTQESSFPFKDHFKKKFMGNQQQQLLQFKKRVLKNPFDKKLQKILGEDPKLQSKVKQLEKINRSSKMKRNFSIPKKRQSLTPLEIYMNKKQLKKNQQINILMVKPNNIISDQQIINRFNNFLVSKKYGDSYNNFRNVFLFAQSLPKQVKFQQIQKRQLELKQIIHSMIKQNKLPEENHENMYQDDQSEPQRELKKVNKNINWILKQCYKYQKKYIIKKIKTKSKSTKKF